MTTSGLTLVVTRGLPGSGKTTAARAWVAADPAGRARVNRDDLRANLFGAPVLEFAQEEAVTAAQRAAVRALLSSGRSVIVDDTGLRARFVRAWSALAASCGATLEVLDLVVPMAVAIQRDTDRLARGERGVGETVIRRLAAQFAIGADGALPRLDLTATSAADAASAYVAPPGAPTAWLVDIDGTLARMNGRTPFEWHRVGEDEPVAVVVDAVHALAARGHRIVVMSGRDEVCRGDTESWLARHGVPFDELHMRPEGNTEADTVIKRRLFDAHVRTRYAVIGVLDDRNQVVALWRSLGLACFQVAPGDF